MKKTVLNLLFLTGVILVITTSCNRCPKSPGRAYMPDMTYSNAYETYSKSPIVNADGDSISARKPVAGTIPRGWIPTDDKIRTNEAFLMSYMVKNHFTRDPSKWQEEYDRAAKEIKDPLPYTKEVTDEGKKIYAINCQVCHGEKGEGNGQIVELPDGSDGPYTARPPVYAKRLAEIKDGNIFYSVSYGKGMMGGYGFQLSVDERWKVIHYIKSLAGINGDATGAGSAAKTDSTAIASAKKK